MQVFIEKLYSDQAFLIQTLLMVVLFLLLIGNLILILRERKRLNRVTCNQDGNTIEETINRYYQDIDKIITSQSKILTSQEEAFAALQECICKVGVVRFNPFNELGGDQSFSIALLDKKDNGIVLSSLFGRNNSRFYGKPIVDAKSDYELSEEEIKAISRAQSGNN